MDKDTKIKIKSMTNGRIGIKIPELRLNRTWEKKGSVTDIDFDTLSQAMYYPGVDYMFKEGILYIDDMEAKKEVYKKLKKQKRGEKRKWKK